MDCILGPPVCVHRLYRLCIANRTRPVPCFRMITHDIVHRGGRSSGHEVLPWSTSKTETLDTHIQISSNCHARHARQGGKLPTICECVVQVQCKSIDQTTPGSKLLLYTCVANQTWEFFHTFPVCEGGLRGIGLARQTSAASVVMSSPMSAW